MNELITAIREYQNYIEQGVLMMRDAFGTQELLRAWRIGKISKKGKIDKTLTYDFHGIGCYMVLNNMEVDFDFGPNNTYGGFEPWRLYSFISQIKKKYPRYSDKKVFDQDFQELINHQIIFNPETDPNLYYFTEKY